MVWSIGAIILFDSLPLFKITSPRRWVGAVLGKNVCFITKLWVSESVNFLTHHMLPPSQPLLWGASTNSSFSFLYFFCSFDVLVAPEGCSPSVTEEYAVILKESVMPSLFLLLSDCLNCLHSNTFCSGISAWLHHLFSLWLTTLIYRKTSPLIPCHPDTNCTAVLVAFFPGSVSCVYAMKTTLSGINGRTPWNRIRCLRSEHHSAGWILFCFTALFPGAIFDSFNDFLANLIRFQLWYLGHQVWFYKLEFVKSKASWITFILIVKV